MKTPPVEIEIIMRDQTKQGMGQVSSSLETVQSEVESTTAIIAALEKQLEELRRQTTATPEVDQSANIAQIEALERKVKELTESLNALRPATDTPLIIPSNLPQLDSEMANTTLTIAALEKQLEELRNTTVSMPEMDQSANIAQIEALEAKIRELQNSMESVTPISNNTNVVPPSLPRAKRQFDGLNFSIQQIAREMPALAMGPQMFFLAISNNLPIFADELSRARREYDALIQSGQKGVPVWKQVLTSLFSWQTAMTTGIMLLVMYGKEIGAWTQDLLGGKSAVDKLRESMALNFEVEKEGHAVAFKTRQELVSTIKSIQEFNGTRDEERRMVDDLNGKYGESFGYYNTLAEYYDILSAKAETYTQILFEQAKQQSLFKKATDYSLEADEMENQLPQNVKGSANFLDYTWAFIKERTSWGGVSGAAEAEIAKHDIDNQTKQIADAEAKSEDFLKQMEESKKKVAELRKNAGLDEVNIGSVGDIERSISIKRTAQKKAASKKEYDDWERQIKEDEKRIAAITGGKKESNNDKSDKTKYDADDLRLAAERRVEEQIVALMAEGAEKKRAQAKANYDKEIDRINKEEKGLMDRYAALQKAGVNVDPAIIANIKEAYASQRDNAEKLHIKAVVDIDIEEDKTKTKNLKKETDDLLREFATYKQREQQIIDDYAAKRRRMYEGDGSTLKSGFTKENAANVDTEEQNARNALDMEIARREVAFNVWSQKILKWGLKELKTALETAKIYLDANSGDLSDNEVAILKAKIKTLETQLETVNAENAEGGSSDKSYKQWGKTLKTMNEVHKSVENIVGSFDGLDETTKSALTAATNISGGIIAMITGIQALSIGGAEAIKGVEKASVILAVIGTAVQILTSIFNLGGAAEHRHQEALAKIAMEKNKMQQEYNNLLFEQNLLLKEAVSIFGVDDITKAINAFTLYQQQFNKLKNDLQGETPTMNFFEKMTNDFFGSFEKKLELYQKGLLGLYDITIKTGHEKTGLFGWGKGQDIYTSILEVYPDLIDAEGELNIARLKAIMTTHEMSEENKMALQMMIDNYENAQKAMDELNSYLENTFGDLGSGIMNAITDGIKNGTDAWLEFGKTGASVLEDLGKQIAYELFFSAKFKTLQEQLKAVYGSGKTPEEIARDANNLVVDFYKNIAGDMSGAEEWMRKWQEEAAKNGLNLWGQDGQQQGRSGAFTTMSQEQGTKLEGLFTSVQMHVVNIEDELGELHGLLFASFDKLAEIADNTAYCKFLKQMHDDIQAMRRDGIKVK